MRKQRNMTYSSLAMDLTLFKKYASDYIKLETTGDLTLASSTISVIDMNGLKKDLVIESDYFASGVKIGTVDYTNKDVIMTGNSTATLSTMLKFNSYTDVELYALNLVLAKSQMKNEIYSHLQLFNDDDASTKLDDLINQNETYFSEMLALKLLQLYFLDKSFNKESYGDMLKNRIDYEYNRYLSGMPNVKSDYIYFTSKRISLT